MKVGSARISARDAVFADDAVAGYDDENGILAECLSDCTDGAWATDALCDVGVGGASAVGDFLRLLPDILLKCRAVRSSCYGEVAPHAAEVFFDLADGLLHRLLFFFCSDHKVGRQVMVAKGDERLASYGKIEVSDGSW